MTSLVPGPSPPHRLHDPWEADCGGNLPRMPGQSQITGRKRKIEDDDVVVDREDPEVARHGPERSSPTPTSGGLSRDATLQSQTFIKRMRTDSIGRSSIALPRLLETLEASSLRTILQNVCTRHPELIPEIRAEMPKPHAESAMQVLSGYEATLHAAFPYGGDRASDYAYNRVRAHLKALLEALADFVPYFLPPNDVQSAQSLSFLDACTTLIHRLPNWHSYQHNLHKQDAYERISQAWIVAIREYGRRAGGLQLKADDWGSKLHQHNHLSGGRLHQAVSELAAVLEWLDPKVRPRHVPDDISKLRQELFSGNFGANVPLPVGQW